jgi:flagellar hook-associated protein 2
MSTISGISGGASLSSAAGIERLIQQTMAAERQPLTRLETQRSDLKVKKGIYNDIKAKLETLRSSVRELTGTYGLLNTRRVSFTEENILDLSVSNSNTDPTGTVYDITVSQLARADRYISNQYSASSSALNLSGNLNINGQTFAIDTGDSLNDIKDKINEFDFDRAGVTAVGATIVDNRLVLTSAKTGTDAKITMANDPGLGLGQSSNDLKAANASLLVNGQPVTRQKNSDLDDIVPGLTFELKKTGATRATITESSNEIANKIKTVLENFNDLVTHLKLKTEPQLDATAVGDKPTYTAAPLGRDFNMRSLRLDLASDMLSLFTPGESGGPRTLSDLGIEIGEDHVSFELAERSKLDGALDDHFDDVAGLFNHILGKLEARAGSYIDGDSAIFKTTQGGLEDRIDALNNQIDGYQSRLKRREETLRTQYYKFQAQLINMQYEYQSTQAAIYGSFNVLNQQG